MRRLKTRRAKAGLNISPTSCRMRTPCADIMLSPRGQQSALRADGAVQARAADPHYKRARRSGAQRQFALRRAVLAHVMPQSELTAESLPPVIDALLRIASRVSASPPCADADGLQLMLDQITQIHEERRDRSGRKKGQNRASCPLASASWHACFAPAARPTESSSPP